MGTIMATASLFPQCFMQFEYEYLLLLRTQLSRSLTVSLSLAHRFLSHRARVSTPCIFYREMRSPTKAHTNTPNEEKREKRVRLKKREENEREKIARKCELNDAREIYRAIAWRCSSNIRKIEISIKAYRYIWWWWQRRRRRGGAAGGGRQHTNIRSTHWQE